MAYSLDFAKAYSYCGRDAAISVPIVLRSGENSVDLVATVDTGASHCLFEGAYARVLGLDPAQGVPKRFRTANSTFEAFGHEVEIEALGVVTHSLAYFFAEPEITKNVLGRGGWLDRVKLGVVDHDRILYLDAFDSPIG